LTPAPLGQPRPGVDLDKALGLAEALENEEMIVNLVQGR
jgi:hypothetical protein